MKEEFRKRYQRYSVDMLVEILQNEHNYLTEAIQAAHEELSSRNCTEKEIDEARARQLASLEQKDQILFEGRNKIDDLFARFFGRMRNMLSKDEIKKPENIVIFLLLINGVIYLYTFFKYSLPFFFNDIPTIGNWDLLTLLILLSELYFPIMFFFIVMKFKSGWYLFSFYQTIAVLGFASNIVLNFIYYEPIESDNSLGQLMNVISPPPPYFYLFANLIFSSIMLVLINLNTIRQYFKIKRAGQIVSFLLALAYISLSILGGFVSSN